MIPNKELREKVGRHFEGLSVPVQNLSNRFEKERAGNELIHASLSLSLARLGRKLDGQWEKAGGTDVVREAVRELTEFLMKHGEPAPHRIDPDVWRFVWVEEEPEPHH